MNFFKHLPFFLFACLLSGHTLAQVADIAEDAPRSDTISRLFVKSITIAGNDKTKSYIILREMQIKAGDSIPASRIYELIEQSRYLIYNTNLFTEVTVHPIFLEGSDISLFVMVKERWYIFPLPQFKLIDRNLNEWINENNADLKRVTYGLKFVHYNFSGRADQLRLYLLNGFNRTISASYMNPYSNRNLTEGFTVAASFVQSREIQYKTSYDNKLLRYNNGEYVKNEFIARASYQLRRGFYRKHVFTIGYQYTAVVDSIITSAFNEKYFNNGKSYVSIPFFGYAFQYLNTDNINYPLKGIRYNVSISKRGLGFTGGMNHQQIESRYQQFTPYGKNWYGSIYLTGTLKAPFNTSYINQRAMGYDGFFMRGLENYVVDGFAAGMAQYTVKKKLLSFNIPVPWKIKEFPSIPFTFFAKTYADAGFSWNTKEMERRLNNRLLYTGGLGIDILTLYDLYLSIDYSFNQLGEKGIFFHVKTNL